MGDVVSIITAATQIGRAIGGLFGSGGGPSRTERLQQLVDTGSTYGTDSPQYKVLERKYSGIAKKHASILRSLPTMEQIRGHGPLPQVTVISPVERMISRTGTAARAAGKVAATAGRRLLGPIGIGMTVADAFLTGPTQTAWDKLTERELEALAREGSAGAKRELARRKAKKPAKKAEKPRLPGGTAPARGSQTPEDPVAPGSPSVIRAPEAAKVSQVKLFLQGFLGGLIQGLPAVLAAPRTGTDVRVSLPPSPFNALQPQSVSSVSYLTGPSAAAVPSAKTKGGRCECPPKKPRKPRQPRTECWGGTYVETATGLRKTKRRRVAC